MTTATMTKSPIHEMAENFKRMLEKGQHMEAIDQFYAQNIENVEGCAMSDPANARLQGLEKVRAMNEQWLQENDIHSCKIEGPYVSERQFALVMHTDVTMKSENRRITMSEVALYSVENNKITRAEFLYGDMK